MSIRRGLAFVFLFFSSTSLFAQEKAIAVDICVYGATSAGVIAAYTARKLGKSVLVIEPGQHPGGLSSGGLGQTDIGNKVAITGWSRDFYHRIGMHYGVKEQWVFEPHVAEGVFQTYLKEGRIDVCYQHRLVKVEKEANRIRQILVETRVNGKLVSKYVRALMFIDCSYEGDLMAGAGVSYTVGRESNATYDETYNGIQLLDKHQFPDGIDPYRIRGNPSSGLLWGISNAALLPSGSEDRSIQAYNFRICLTDNPGNRRTISKPPGYDSSRYELLIRQIERANPDSLNWQLMHIAPMPNHKTDINNCGGFSSDMIGMNYEYAEGSWEKRRAIVDEHLSYTKGWLYFLGHDARIPVHLRNEMNRWGYPLDEYRDSDNFTQQLYIRESRRMISDYVMTQRNCEGKEVVSDGIGLAAYTMDSHNCQRVVVNGMVKNEGDVQVGGFGPYPVSYRSIIPKADQCSNLLVPVCLSASHIAYGSIRMEPVFMVLAQSAATAAALAIKSSSPVQSVNVAELRAALTK